MQTRYSPPWIPVVIVALLLVCVILFTALVVRSSSSSNSPKTVGLSASNESFRWKLVTTWPKRFPGLGLAPENFAVLVNEMSNGRLIVDVHGANEIVPPLGVFGAVSSGSVEMGHSAAYYWKGKMLAAPFFTSIPFGMNVQELNGWIHYGGGMELWRELYAPHNVIPFSGGNTSVQMGGWFNREINSLEDILGLKMRIPGLGGEVFTRAGGIAVNIPGGELYTALQTGVIDATEWVGPYNDLAFGFQDIAKYYYYPGWQEPGPALEFIVNKTAFEKLPKDLQKIVEVATRAINQDMLDEYTARNNNALIELKNVHNVDVRQFPEEVMLEFESIAWEMYEKFSEEDPMFNKIFTSYKTFMIGAENYHKISEQVYYNLRGKGRPENISRNSEEASKSQ